MEENQNPRDPEESGVIKAEGSGKTVAEAEAEALGNLFALVGDFDRDSVELVVVDEGSKGFLGMGSSMARVEARLAGAAPKPGLETEAAAEADTGEAGAATIGEAVAQAPGEPAEAAPADSVLADSDRELAVSRLREYLEKVVDSLGLEGSVSISEEEEMLVGDVSGDSLGLFIGRHGQTIDAIQYIANITVFRGLTGRKRVVVDAEDYRERRVESLQALAERAAAEVMGGKPEFEFKPMSAAERRIVHIHLQDREGVKTSSEGREPYRRVIVTRD